MRQRPEVHFTPERGWMNDPHGIVFADGRYHLFFQYVPRDIAWHSDLEWGHAVSPDLVHWQHIDSALTPLPNETGLWSGSVVMADVPTMFYTNPRPENWGQGQVIVARGNHDLTAWERVGLVIDGAPGAEFRDFRDPQVRGDGDAWKMTVGAGMQDGSGGCALQFSSSDLLQWHYDGVLATEPFDPHAPINTGEVWECPQFLRVGDEWVLIISAMELEQKYILQVYAIGDYDGVRFTPRVWGDLGHGNIAYAATTFTDTDGVPCVMAWLRESGAEVPAGSPWAGAQSVVHELHIVGDAMLTPFHRNLDAVLPSLHVTDAVEVDFAHARRFAVDAARGLTIENAEHVVTLQLNGGRALVFVDGAVALDANCGGATSFDVVVDAGWLEFVCSDVEGFYVARIPSMATATVRAG